ncbi:hypothetical protein F2P81_002973 [Scophthalmus maximus]|uniref:Uncharacterized protein n=1 Tax=Scophthalmus maximus TaxID=52904 RepID=A0A6A4TF12_SCOMX|nr:hypothetical protein F2P81_002973 [Scophthalmus maximus]
MGMDEAGVRSRNCVAICSHYAAENSHRRTGERRRNDYGMDFVSARHRSQCRGGGGTQLLSDFLSSGRRRRIRTR